jgi:hypothetical protein
VENLEDSEPDTPVLRSGIDGDPSTPGLTTGEKAPEKTKAAPIHPVTPVPRGNGQPYAHDVTERGRLE